MPDKSSPAAQANAVKFREQLAKEYTTLFRDNPDYAYSASKNTPEALAEKMTVALVLGKGNKDGEGIKRTCKALGIPYTYKGIKSFLQV